MDPQMSEESVDYNQILVQISANLTNALNSFGPASPQYQAILGMLKECLRDLEGDRDRKSRGLNPDTLSLAMGFLKIAK